MLIAYAALMTVFVYVIYNYLKMIKIPNLPGPTVLPVLGNALKYTGNPTEFFKAAIETWETYGFRLRVYIGNKLFVVITDYKDVEVLLSSNFLIEKSEDYNFLKVWLGTGLLTSSGEKWHKHRKVITPTFHFKILEHFIEVFNRQSDVLVNKFKCQVDKGNFDIFPYVTLCALDIISEAAMGVSIDAQNKSDSEYVTAVKELCGILNRRMKHPIKRNDFLFKFTADYQLQQKSLKILHGFTEKMIKERKALLEKNKENLESYMAVDESLGIKKKLAFLDMLLLSKIDGKPLSDLDVREEVDTILFEGHDTTTSGISFSLYLISKNPEIQEKLFQEQKEIFGDNFDRQATYSDFQNMKYMEMFLKESMRLYPPVPMIARRMFEDTKINDLEIPKDATVLVFNYTMNRISSVFPSPEKCIPERFAPEEVAKRNPYATVNFSAGPRNCIGQKFAMLEMKSMISKLIREYELLPSNIDVMLTGELILKSMNGVNIKLRNRMQN